MFIAVAKRKSLFNDRPTEIQELTYMIKEDLNSLNGQIARLQEVAKGQRSHQSGRSHLLTHSSSVVISLQSRLANMSSEFKQVLEVRTEVSLLSWILPTHGKINDACLQGNKCALCRTVNLNFISFLLWAHVVFQIGNAGVFIQCLIIMDFLYCLKWSRTCKFWCILLLWRNFMGRTTFQSQGLAKLEIGSKQGMRFRKSWFFSFSFFSWVLVVNCWWCQDRF